MALWSLWFNHPEANAMSPARILAASAPAARLIVDISQDKVR